MAALVAAAQDSDYPAEIALVLSNIPDAAGLAYAKQAGIATATVAHAPFGKDRAAFERAMLDVLTAHRIDIVCLAGFMRLLTPLFIGHWSGRIVNIHPALLPSYKGLHTHERALADGVKIHGATVHFVVPEMDSGPIIAQGALAVRDDDDAQSLARRVLAIEHRLYPLALRLLAQGSVRIADGRCLIDGLPANDELLLSPQP